MLPFFEYSPEVAQALQQKKPVLALESTLITHGFPHPHNVEIAQLCEQITRDAGVTPATIAIMNGKIKIGLTENELDLLVKDKNSVKASTRDISYVISKKINAGTTVAATAFCAYRAGIKVFATGGIGGVHRGDSQDISADLTELSRTPIAIVCAGVKAILDLPRTLEYLETFSIPVIGYRTNTLPAFYTASTNYRLTTRIDEIKELAKLLHTHWGLGLTSGILVANPIPVEHEIPADTIEPLIAEALTKADTQHISGKAITPYLLQEIVTATQGNSLKTNMALIKNNVKVGAELARELGNA